MLTHHSSQDYGTAARAAAGKARAEFERLIENGSKRAAAVFSKVETEQPDDMLVRARAITIAPADAARLVARFGNGADHELGFHRHALQQAAGRLGVPWAYLESLLTVPAPEGAPADAPRPTWGAELAAHNLNKLLAEGVPHDARYLVRSVRNEARGWLSDRYRRLDSRPIVESFATACQRLGAVPCEGHALDTKIMLKAMLPYVFEPVDHEVMCVGVALENSDFGNGALSLRSFVLRLWCTNTAIADQNVREVHLGARLAEDIEWSDATYNLDTQRMALMVGDVVRGQLGPAKVDKLMDGIRRANEQKIDPKVAIAAIGRDLTKGEVAAVVEKFNSPDVELLPPGNTKWRLSNAISWLAGTQADEERRIELEKVAGSVMTGRRETGAAEAAAQLQA